MRLLSHPLYAHFVLTRTSHLLPPFPIFPSSLREKTQSIWTAVLLDRARFTNPRYQPSTAPSVPLPEGGYEVWPAYWDVDKLSMEEPRVYSVPNT